LLERKSGGERRKALETILRDLGVRYEVQRYAAGPGEGANFFFDLGGGAKTLIVSAHHDAVPGSPGANDDASCVSAILDAYTKLRRTPPANLKVRFIFFDGEEIGLKGSKEYVRAHDLKNVLAMFSLELCGIGDAAAVWESEETERKTPAIRTLLETLEENNVAHLVEGDIPKFGSDHESFRKAGIPALALSIFPKKEESILREFIFNPGSPKWADRGSWPSIFRHYHTPDDTAGRLREDAMALMSEIIYRTVLRLDRTLKKSKRIVSGRAVNLHIRPRPTLRDLPDSSPAYSLSPLSPLSPSPSGGSPSRVTLARARSREWDRLRCARRTPRASATSRATPVNRSVGGPPSSRRTSTSFQVIPRAHPTPRAFKAASFAAKRTARCPSGRPFDSQ